MSEVFDDEYDDSIRSDRPDAGHGEAVGAVENEDPFAPGNVEAFTLITLMRIYDVQMALLNGKYPDMASRLNDVHTQGKFIGSFPWIAVEDE